MYSGKIRKTAEMLYNHLILLVSPMWSSETNAKCFKNDYKEYGDCTNVPKSAYVRFLFSQEHCNFIMHTCILLD